MLEDYPQLFLESFPVGALQCNCTILGCMATNEAIVVDPGGDVEQILRVLKQNNFELKHIVHTHAHFDHIGGTYELQQAAGGEVWLHTGDEYLYDNFELQVTMFGGLAVKPVPALTGRLLDRQQIDFGQGQSLVLHTPGHTPGSCCFQVRRESDVNKSSEQILLAGDTLFRRGVGRTDLWGGDSKQLLDSIREKLYCLDDDTLVIPGHGPATKVGEEKTRNPFVTAH